MAGLAQVLAARPGVPALLEGLRTRLHGKEE